MQFRLVKLVRMERVRTSDGFAYIAVLSEDEKTLKVPVSPSHLLSYAAMQEHLLLGAGVMLVNEAVEGRVPTDADRVWKIIASRAFIDVAASSSGDPLN